MLVEVLMEAVKKVSELSGSELAYWVGRATKQDVELYPEDDQCVGFIPKNGVYYFFEPHLSWNQAGRLIEHFRICFAAVEKGVVASRVDHSVVVHGSNYLEATCRCIVVSAFGREVKSKWWDR